MVYFVSCDRLYDGAYTDFLDDPRDSPYADVGYEADPATLDLRATELESIEKGHTAMGHGYRVDGSNAPKKVHWKGGDNILPDMIETGIKAVSRRLRELIEQFEPGVHQFFPVDIYKSKSGEVFATYYWINICNRVDSLDPDKTTYAWKKDYTGVGFWSRVGVDNAKLVFSLKKIGDHHFWFDPFLGGGIFCSNAFANDAQSGNFLGLNLTPHEDT